MIQLFGGKPPNPHFSFDTFSSGASPRTPRMRIPYLQKILGSGDNTRLNGSQRIKIPRSTDQKSSFRARLRFCSRLFLDYLKYPSSLGCASRRRIFGGLGKTLEQSPTRNILLRGTGRSQDQSCDIYFISFLRGLCFLCRFFVVMETAQNST